MKIPKVVREAWENREGPIVLATVDSQGRPNIIYVLSVSFYGEDRFLVADNYFDKTRKNIDAGSKGSVLFITKDRQAYQLKGTLEYHVDGPMFKDMKKWNPAKFPGLGVAALIVDDVYCGAQRLTS